LDPANAKPVPLWSFQVWIVKKKKEEKTLRKSYSKECQSSSWKSTCQIQHFMQIQKSAKMGVSLKHFED
jgi:hypothetical protein